MRMKFPENFHFFLYRIYEIIYFILKFFDLLKRFSFFKRLILWILCDIWLKNRFYIYFYKLSVKESNTKMILWFVFCLNEWKKVCFYYWKMFTFRLKEIEHKIWILYNFMEEGFPVNICLADCIGRSIYY